MIVKKFLAPVFCLVLMILTFQSKSHSAQTLSDFEKEFEWINVKKCKRPPIEPPAPIWIVPLGHPETFPKKISVRRWLDADGDGLCELYDVEKLETSLFTGKIYGYPRRVSTYKKGSWAVNSGVLNGWLPLLLLDRATGTRFDVSYSYGAAGYTAGATGLRPSCESMRQTLAEGYMLFFRFPKFAKDDPVMDPAGEWNSYQAGYIGSQYPGKENFLASPVSEECKEKYRLVIDALARELGY